MVCFLLPRCKCHPGCIQAQRPAGRASWPAALCTSSLLHIWMYLGSTTNHQRPKIQPMAQFFVVVLHKPTYLKSQYMMTLKEYKEREKIQGERRDAGKTI